MLCLYRKGYDFKRLFTLSEHYDRDRPSYYPAIQSVRQRNLDLTDWLVYFTLGLQLQLAALELAQDGSTFQMQDFEARCPGVHRRSLQRDLRQLVDFGLLETTGATNRLVYRGSSRR